jgi:hypothetical protein
MMMKLLKSLLSKYKFFINHSKSHLVPVQSSLLKGGAAHPTLPFSHCHQMVQHTWWHDCFIHSFIVVSENQTAKKKKKEKQKGI